MNGKPLLHLLLSNLPFGFIHWFNVLMLRILRMKKWHSWFTTGNQKLTSKLESQNISSEIYDSNRELSLTHSIDPSNKNKPKLRKIFIYYRKSNHFVPNCSRKQQDYQEKKLSFSSLSKLSLESFIQNFQFSNKSHSNEQPSVYPKNYYSRKSNDARNCS